MSNTNNSSGRQAKPQIQVDPFQDRDGTLKELGGSRSDGFNRMLADQVAGSLWLAPVPQDSLRKHVAAAVSGLVGIGPKDELEGMMAAQMIAVHSAAMECFRRAMIGGQTFEGRNQSLAFANKLTRSFAALVEALDRHRGKGQQKVTVEHVHVHQGGQAIVGNVTPGGGSPQAIEGQSHEPKGLAPPDGAPLPCSFETDQAAMPQSGGAR